jgi:TolB-like protein
MLGERMKTKLFFVILINLAVIGWTQQLTTAVTPFTARSGYSEAELKDITELFAGFLTNTNEVRVFTRSQWGAIIGEHQFQRGGLVSQTEIRQLGVALGAQAVITGTLMKLGRNNILNLSLLDVESGEILSAARSTFESLDEFLDVLPALASDIAGLLKNKYLNKNIESTIRKICEELFPKLRRNSPIAVLHIKSGDPGITKIFIDGLNHQLLSSGQFTILDPVLTDIVVRQEQQINFDFELRDNLAIDFGRMLGADIVIFGSI